MAGTASGILDVHGYFYTGLQAVVCGVSWIWVKAPGLWCSSSWRARVSCMAYSSFLCAS